MGEVFRARDTKLGREVALKLLPPDVAKDEERVTRFRREARSLASVHHPNVATLFGVEETSEEVFLVMELVEGEDLGEMLRSGPLPVATVVDFIRQLVAGLSAAHRRGIVHRDLKPQNIRITPEGQVKILDFGLAVHVDETRITQPGTNVGTFAYMSPEQIRGESLDARSDLFSLGILVHEMITGSRAFRGENPATVLHAILSERPGRLAAERSDVPPYLQELVDRCLAKEPADRWPDAESVLTALPDPVSAGANRGPTPRSSRRGIWVAFLIVAVVASILAERFLRSPPPESKPVTSVEFSRLAVLPFQNLTPDESLQWLEQGFAELLTSSLSQAQDYRVVSSRRVGQLMEASDAPPIELLRNEGIPIALTGSMVPLESGLSIQGELVETATGEVLYATSVRGEGDADVFAMAAELTSAIRTHLEIRGLGERIDEHWIQGLMTESVAAFREFVRGRQQMVVTNWARGAHFFERAVAIDSLFVTAWVDLSSCYWNLGDEAKTEFAFQRAQALRESATPRERAWLDLFAAVREGDGHGQVLFARELLEIDPDDLFVRYLLGRGHYQNGQYERAVEVWQPLVDRRWEWAWTYVYGSRALLELGRLDEADALVDQAFELVREDDSEVRAALHLRRSEIAEARGDLASAASALTRARALSPQDLDLVYRLGVLYQDAGDKVQARSHLREYLDASGDLTHAEDARERLSALR